MSESVDRPALGRTLLRYAAFQVPGWLLVGAAAWAAVHWFGVATWMALAGVGLFVLKDALLFPLLRRSYERDGRTHGPVGEHGVVEDAIDGEGWVRVGAERWRARVAGGSAPIERGARVRIVAVHGLTLHVEAAPDSE
ncbi:MAG: NfeD family protein [Myxococcota bacterium]|nr:NfeD family protein [Myxococcota bacterium]